MWLSEPILSNRRMSRTRFLHANYIAPIIDCCRCPHLNVIASWSSGSLTCPLCVLWKVSLRSFNITNPKEVVVAIFGPPLTDINILSRSLSEDPSLVVVDCPKFLPLLCQCWFPCCPYAGITIRGLRLNSLSTCPFQALCFFLQVANSLGLEATGRAPLARLGTFGCSTSAGATQRHRKDQT